MMLARPGLIIASLITMFLSILLGYLSIEIMESELVYSLGGLLVMILLLALAAGSLRGNFVALTILSVFYIVLAVTGMIISVRLPPEGLLVTVFSASMGLYLWKHRKNPFKEVLRGEEGGSGEVGPPREDLEEGASEEVQ